MEQKSKGVAYLLWFFFGALGAHKFYIGKVGMGVVYLLTGGLFFIGVLVDLFTLGNQVDAVNALNNSHAGNNMQNIVVNVANGASPSGPMKTSAEKQILHLAQDNPQLSLRDIVSNTELEVDEAETALQRMADKGLIKEMVDPSGKKIYDAS